MSEEKVDALWYDPIDHVEFIEQALDPLVTLAEADEHLDLRSFAPVMRLFQFELERACVRLRAGAKPPA